MSRRWEEPAYIKIHEGCGGRVRWVEAIDTPGVGYTGECDACGRGRIVVEDIIPVQVRGEWSRGSEYDVREAVLDASTEALAGLEWDEKSDFETNQSRLRAVFQNPEFVTDG